MPSTCVTDLSRRALLGGRLRGPLRHEDHPNCQDTLAEAIGEYGLTPDDVHDSLKFLDEYGVDHIGYYTVWNTGKAGDYVDLLALMDVLAVPVTCGSGESLGHQQFLL